MKEADLKERIKSLPDSPGVYKYFDAEGVIIYVGKAKSLRKRVASYFNKVTYENHKTAVLVKKIANIEFTLVDTEYDALLLENALIKKFQPRFNISLKDDKTYPYIRITPERFPRIVTTRKPVKDGSEYFGPYASGLLMNTILDLIKSLYPTRNCTLILSEENIAANKFRACLEYQIGNCMAPCIGKQTEADYDITIKEIKNILRGNISEVKNHIRQSMEEYSRQLAFEKAAYYKHRLDLLANYQSKSTIVSHTISNVDVLAIVSDDQFAYVNYLKVVNGIVTQTQTVELKKKLSETDEELLAYAMLELRTRFKSYCNEVIVPIEIEAKWQDITYTIPKAGDKKKLLELASKNAFYFKKEKLDQYEKVNPGMRTDRILNQMMKDLRLKVPPKHIECFDNSNIQGHFPVSACVVFKEAKPSKKDYRHFNVQTVKGPDDFATMREVVYRRYKRVLDDNDSLPDLIVIDGGKGQLSAAVESMKLLGIYGKVPVLGIAKRLEELYYPEDELPLYINKKSETLKVIQQIRDEAHRFGITHHRKRRSKAAFDSELLQIKGVGEKNMKLLLEALKSVKKIKDAPLTDIEKIVGNAKAKLVWDYFHSNELSI
jgi:excinuclease ABC subunit C